MHRKSAFSSLLMIILAAFLGFGCARTNAPSPSPSLDAKKVSDFFPLTEGSTWQYQGQGNEFASFRREVIRVKGDRAQIREDNGGTVSNAVFQTKDGEIVRIFFQGESYEEKNYLEEKPQDSLVILKKPLQVGTKWDEPKGTREIVDVSATVDTPAGKFANCIKVKISSPDSTLYEYFMEGVGMVKREFVSGDARVTSTLEKYRISPSQTK